MLKLLPKSPAGKRYGARPSPRDNRDFDFARFAKFLESFGGVPAALPAAMDLRQYCGPVRDQGDEGSCTGHAGYAMRMLLANKYQSGKFNNLNLSPAFIYYIERSIDGTLSQGDCGSTGRTCCQALTKFGVCSEADDMYVAGQFDQAPSEKAYADALTYKAGAYHALTSVADMKACLASGYGFIVGFAVYESFEQGAWASGSGTNVMPVPDKASENCLGGHEVFFCGYDDAKQAFLVQNSWGAGWGDGGFFWFPYECAADPDVLFDAFIAHLGKPW